MPNLMVARTYGRHNDDVIMFVKVLQNILFVGGFIAICVLVAVISAFGKPELGLLPRPWL
jgi:hypothetical protein